MPLRHLLLCQAGGITELAKLLDKGHIASPTGEAALAAVCSKLPNNLREKRLLVWDTSVTCCCRISDMDDL